MFKHGWVTCLGKKRRYLFVKVQSSGEVSQKVVCIAQVAIDATFSRPITQLVYKTHVFSEIAENQKR